jgi:hypothetical protein
VTSYNTSASFPIRSTLTCATPYLIYIIRDTVCGLDYIGHTEDIKARWANHKSHIKRYVKSCELATHMQSHTLDRSSLALFDRDLSCQLELIFIEQVFIDPTWDHTRILSKLENRESFWQCQLKVSIRLGGMCKRGRRPQA